MITEVGWIALAVGTVCGVLAIYLLIQIARYKTPAINQPFETNGEADLMPRQKSFADVKDTF